MMKFISKPLLTGSTGALAIPALLLAGAAALASPAAAAGDYDVGPFHIS